MKSDFLDDIMTFPYLKVCNRVGNHVMCYMEADGKEMHFLVTDDSDWYGVATAQFQGQLNEQQFERVIRLIAEMLPSPLPRLFGLECHDLTYEVRVMLRWPLYGDYRGYEDVKQLIPVLFDYWTTVEPFIRRAAGVEDLHTVIAEANQQLERLNPHPVRQDTA